MIPLAYTWHSDLRYDQVLDYYTKGRVLTMWHHAFPEYVVMTLNGALAFTVHRVHDEFEVVETYRMPEKGYYGMVFDQPMEVRT